MALNDEMTALARAGLPLERGLREVGRDVSGGLSKAMLGLSARMERGASLAEALADEGDRFPAIYRAVVTAGVRAGRLPAALESLAGFIQGYAESRRAIGQALWYPMIVVSLAYVLFLAMTVEVMPRFAAAYASFRVPAPAAMRLLGTLGRTAVYWAPVFPALLVALLFWWAWTGRASSLRASGPGSLLRWFPWMRSMLANLEAASFAELLAMLVEQAVPYAEAIVLAADASGDPALMRSGRAVAAAAVEGDTRAAEQAGGAIPPLLRWLLATGSAHDQLANALRQLAASYRKRAGEQEEKIRMFLGAIVLLAVGVSATLLYGLTLFVPLSSLLRGLAMPVGS
jgi:general secretion pathway protein F